MDDLRLSLRTKLFRGIAGKFISRKISKQMGRKIEIRFDEMEIETVEDKVILRVKGEAVIDKTKLAGLIEEIGEQEEGV